MIHEIYDSSGIGKDWGTLSHFSLGIFNEENSHESPRNYKHLFNEEVSNPGEKYKTSLYLEMSSIIEKLQIEGI